MYFFNDLIYFSTCLPTSGVVFSTEAYPLLPSSRHTLIQAFSIPPPALIPSSASCAPLSSIPYFAQKSKCGNKYPTVSSHCYPFLVSLLHHNQGCWLLPKHVPLCPPYFVFVSWPRSALSTKHCLSQNISKHLSCPKHDNFSLSYGSPVISIRLFSIVWGICSH